MTFLVEDGTGVTGANAYVSEAELGSYADDRAIALASGDAEAAIIRGTAYIEGTYSPRYPGYKTFLREQPLGWPRTSAYDANGDLIDNDEIPQEIKDATCEAAIRELTTPGAMQPDLDRGGAVKRLKAGSVEIEYTASAPLMTTYSIIAGILSGLLGAATPFSGRAVRG